MLFCILEQGNSAIFVNGAVVSSLVALKNKLFAVNMSKRSWYKKEIQPLISQTLTLQFLHDRLARGIIFIETGKAKGTAESIGKFHSMLSLRE